MALTNEEIPAKGNAIRQAAVSDSALSEVTGGTGEREPAPKFHAGDRVRLIDIAGFGPGEIVTVYPRDGKEYFYDIRFNSGVYNFPEEDLYAI